MLKAGRYEAHELGIEAYHADKETVSRTSIMAYDKCPRMYQALYISKEVEKEVTKPMLLGSAFHTLILEKHLFEQRVAVYPSDIDRRTNAGKAAYAEFQLASTGKIMIDAETMDTINGMKDALANHLEAATLVWGNQPVFERSYIYGDDGSGLVIKARPDILQPNCIVDLKTCQSADEYSFRQSVLKNGNHIQGAMVQDGIRLVDAREDALTLPVVNIAIETRKPYCIAIYFISLNAIQSGRERYQSVLKRMKASFDTGVYPSYETKEIDLPNWYTTVDEI